MTNPRTVLVVEDNPIERKGVAAVLGQEGYDAVVAANGKEALERLRSKPTPDAMLLDMMMSELDGWQLLKLLRQYPALLAVPVIIVTGLGIANRTCWMFSIDPAMPRSIARAEVGRGGMGVL
jgi:CheY-like chemotaxis protein